MCMFILLQTHHLSQADNILQAVSFFGRSSQRYLSQMGEVQLFCPGVHICWCPLYQLFISHSLQIIIRDRNETSEWVFTFDISKKDSSSFLILSNCFSFCLMFHSV